MNKFMRWPQLTPLPLSSKRGVVDGRVQSVQLFCREFSAVRLAPSVSPGVSCITAVKAVLHPASIRRLPAEPDRCESVRSVSSVFPSSCRPPAPNTAKDRSSPARANPPLGGCLTPLSSLLTPVPSSPPPLHYTHKTSPHPPYAARPRTTASPPPVPYGSPCRCPAPCRSPWQNRWRRNC